ncbi:Imidazolonepropionase [Ignavibacterium album JCM 16511]|uniref:Imidazolonepropionase n=1 Tax=Ignavibacterium album (strain DSM 19864 / JCM 16511 / NBRC 101810 / Mat9-16) TaxID=945713 RepID=I0AJK3_IGNAJ|nr:imidazolonepropionase [Ignavibacterium album]AFH49160.1 Imidazolonepropionase [Ignavibacterium album JCM 16511]
MKLLTNAEQIVSCNTNGKNFKKGKEQSELEVITSHTIIIENDLIKDIVPTQSVKNPSGYEVIDLRNKIILPGLVECHTHTAFAGSRADEFKMKLDGVHYEEIAAKGGGILKTVNAVREKTLTELVEIIKPRIEEFIAQGITTLEIKSGYGLDFENEIKLLHAIKILDEIYPIEIVPTFLGAHTYPIEFKNHHKVYLEEITNKMIPHIAKNNLAEFCDAFCETTAFSSDEVDMIFVSAKEHGLMLKLHTEQFNNIGGIDVALKYNAVSVDHLEVLKDDDIPKLASADIVCDLLPGVSFFLNYQFAPARKLIDSGAIVALSTDFNPGSSHILNFHLIMQLAALKLRMKIEEIINAVTINAAKSLKRNNKIGSIEIGKKADFSIFDTKEYSDIIYSVGRNLNCMTIKNGEVIFSKQ